jgi:glycine C-acetyltransferase
VSEVSTEVLDAIRARGTFRSLRVVDGTCGPRTIVDGREVLLFAGCNYLDLAGHPEVAEASARAAHDLGCAAGGSRLINGNLALHEALEQDLAKFVGTESALVFASGYMANVGIIPALVGRGDVIVSDALSHASIIDGCRLSHADVRVFAHGDLTALADLLEDCAPRYRRVLLAIDGVYSMDGDVAPLAEIVALAREHHAMLLLDDAHGMGALGDHGRGTPELCGVDDGIDVYIGTLGKAVGTFGAFAAGSGALRELLINTARSFIFSCALAPPQVSAARAALGLLRGEPWRRKQLHENAARVRAGLAERGISTGESTTHIIPVLIGDNEATMRIAERLLDRGFYTQGIRHPSVPENTARLRITPMATHRAEEIDALCEAVADEVTRAS